MTEFSNSDKQRLKDALTSYLRVTDEEALETIATDMLETGTFRTFGYGSLIKVPFTEAKAKKYDATLHGQVMRFNAAWINYGGTEEFKNLILGLEDSEDGSTPGVVSENNIFEIAGKKSVDAIIECLKDWQKRENPENSPSYRFEFKSVQPMDGSAPVMAIACIADENGPFFVGDALTLKEKAIIIASEFGDDRQRTHSGLFNKASNQAYHHKSIRNYLLDCIDARLEKGFPVEKELVELVKAVNYFRSQMPIGEQLYMEERESGLLDSRDALEPKVSFTEGLELVAKRTDKYTAEYIEARYQWKKDTGQLTDGCEASNDELSQTEKNAIGLKVFRELNREVSGIAPELYDLCAGGPELSEKEFYSLQWQARNKLRVQLAQKPLKDLPPGYPMDTKMPLLNYLERPESFNMQDEAPEQLMGEEDYLAAARASDPTLSAIADFHGLPSPVVELEIFEAAGVDCEETEHQKLKPSLV